MSTEQFDVVVVGGGPAGLAAAEAAARQGARTLVLEKQGEIGYPIHTSGGSWVSDMKALKIPEHLYHPASKLIFASTNREVSWKYDSSVVCVVDVRGLYQHLAERAVAAGAVIRMRHTVDEVLRENGRVTGVVARTHRGERLTLAAPVTIDASGYGRQVSSRADMGDAFKRYGFGAEYDLYAPQYPQDEAFLIVGDGYAPNGYAWAFPRGNGRVRVGVGVTHPDNNEDPRDYLDSMIRNMPQLASRLAGASPLEYHTGLFPCAPPRERFVCDGMVMAGDSGAQGSTLFGEGIRFAIYSGQMAGEVAAQAVQSGDTSATYLGRFEQRWRARFGRDMDISYMINERVSTYGDAQWDRLLDLLRRVTPSQMAQLVRADYSAGLILGILARNPSVLAKGGKRLLDRVLEHIRASGRGGEAAGPA